MPGFWSHSSLLGGYYLLLNPIIVYYDGYYPMLNYAVTPSVRPSVRQIEPDWANFVRRESLLTVITTMVLLRVPRREASGYAVMLCMQIERWAEQPFYNHLLRGTVLWWVLAAPQRGALVPS